MDVERARETNVVDMEVDKEVVDEPADGPAVIFLPDYEEFDPAELRGLHLKNTYYVLFRPNHWTPSII